MRLTLCKENERNGILREIERRFGIPTTVFEGHILVVRGKKEVWVTRNSVLEVGLEGCVRTGIPLLRWTTKGFRLTSSAVRAFGALATRGVVEIPPHNRGFAERFIRGEEIPLTTEEELVGQVIVRWKGQPLGPGLVQSDRIKNQVPVKMRVRGRICSR